MCVCSDWKATLLAEKKNSKREEGAVKKIQDARRSGKKAEEGK
jgi:hypothetical protein